MSWTDTELAYRAMTAVTSFHKSLLLSQEAVTLLKSQTQPILPTLLTQYASVFQLGLSHFLVQASFQEVDVDRLREAIRRRGDLAEVVRRSWVQGHLTEMSKEHRLVRTAAAFAELCGLRDDMQYGPRLRGDDSGFLLDSCKNPADRVAQRVATYVEGGQVLLDEFVADLEGRHSLPYILVEHATFMLESPTGLGPYYSSAARQGAQQYAQALRKRLYPNAED